MYLSIAILDYLSPDGLLHTFRVIPKRDQDSVVVDWLRDLDRGFQGTLGTDLGAFRVHNISECVVHHTAVRLRGIAADHGKLEFRLEHVSVPITQGEGYYCLVLPELFALEDFDVVGDFDNEPEKQVLCDPKNNIMSVAFRMWNRERRVTLRIRGQARRVAAITEDLIPHWPRTYKSYQQDSLAFLSVMDKQPIEIAEMIRRGASSRETTRRILAVFANPKGSDPLRLGSEDRVIRECIQLGRHRDSLQLTVLHAATVNDLRRAFLNGEYDVLHFSGHGTGQGLALEDEVGAVKLVPPKALARLCADYSPPLQCVVLNACYSKAQAKLVSDGVPFTIGMKSAISDAGAIEFTRGFYDALGAGKGFGRSFEEGSRSLDLSGYDMVDKPVCFGADREG